MIDYNKVIGPINEKSPCGIDIRIDSQALSNYSKLKDIRITLRRQERKAIESEQNYAIDQEGWQEVISLAELILSNYSKDIEVSSWLVEGLVRVEGLEGLELGLGCLVELLNAYGPDLYPREEGDADNKDDQLIPIATLGGKYEAGTLIAPIYFADLFTTRSEEKYNAWRIKGILNNDKNANNYQISQKQVEENQLLAPILSDINNEILIKKKKCIENCITNFNKLNALLSTIFSSSAPDLTNLSNVLSYCASLVNIFSNLTTVSSENKEIKHEETVNDTQLSSKNIISIDKLLEMQLDKTTAKRMLGKLVGYFREAEPHSPISYTLERVLNWTDLSLPEMLCDLIPDKVREAYCTYTGIPFVKGASEYIDDTNGRDTDGDSEEFEQGLR